MRGIFQDGGRFGNFRTLISLLSYFLRLYNWLADFSFTERCYWYLQSALNPCLKAAPLSVEKPDFPDFLQILFLSTSSLRRAIPVLPEPLELVSSQFFSAWVEDGSKEERRHFLLMNFMVVTAVALWFDAI